VKVTHRDRYITAETKRIEPMHPGVIARFRTAGIFHVLQLWSGQLVETPALGAMLARRGRPSEHLALSPVEAGEMSAGQRRPEHAVVLDISAAWSEAR